MKANARTKREQDQMQKGELGARVVGLVVLTHSKSKSPINLGKTSLAIFFTADDSLLPWAQLSWREAEGVERVASLLESAAKPEIFNQL